MSAIAASQVAAYPPSSTTLYGGDWDLYMGGVTPQVAVRRVISITGVTAGDTATAAVLGFQTLIGAHSATYGGPDTNVVPVGVDFVDNELIIGAGPANQTVYLVVEGIPTTSY